MVKKKQKQKYNYGVYMNPRGQLWWLGKGEKTTYLLVKGEKCTNRTINALLRLGGHRRPYMEWTFAEGYFADKFLAKCEYLGT